MLRFLSNLPCNNSDRSLPPTKPDRLFPHIKQRSPLITHKPDRLFLKTKQ
ncbi:MAG: hypothetical protein ACOYN8_11075 [Pseudanabaena sp.]